MQVDENGRKYILFRINIYFSEYLLAAETDKKAILTETLLLRRKDKKPWKKNLVVNLLKLIQVNFMIKIIKLLEHKHLLVSLKTSN